MDAIFKRVTRHLNKLDIVPKLTKLPPLDMSMLRGLRQKLGLSLPADLHDLYLNYAGGLMYSWFAEGAFGALQIPMPKDLSKQLRGWKELVLWMDDYDFPHVKNSTLARKTYAKMKHWLPLIGEGNGDGFCLDCASSTGAVVFHQHDWYDGGSGDNGHVVAPDLRRFIENWATVCFTSPRQLFWTETFVARGVSWTRKHFKTEYIIPN
jgi:cell wall assembly regulator SMI1